MNIVPDLETEITDHNTSLEDYRTFAREELKLEQVTINNQKSVILGFLRHSKGKINKDTVKEYLDSNESLTWKTNQIKALRRYLRDFLKLGRWIEEFDFSKAAAKPKEIYRDAGLENLDKNLLDGNLEYLHPIYVRLVVKHIHQQTIIFQGDITPFGIDKVEEITNDSLPELSTKADEANKSKIEEIREEKNSHKKVKRIYDLAVENKGFILDVIIKLVSVAIKGT